VKVTVLSLLAIDIAFAYLSLPDTLSSAGCLDTIMITRYIASQPYRIPTRIRARPIPYHFLTSWKSWSASAQCPSASREEQVQAYWSTQQACATLFDSWYIQ
jgi:hypothetical protein